MLAWRGGGGWRALAALATLLAGVAEAKKQGGVAPSPPSPPGQAHGVGAGEVSTDSLSPVYDHERWEIDPDEVELGEKIGEGE